MLGKMRHLLCLWTILFSLRQIQPLLYSISCFSILTYDQASAASYTRPMTKVISTKYGVVRGLLTQFTPDSKPQLQPVESYLGIPYAAPPVGSLRFMPPTTPQQFEGGVRNATKFGPVCPQSSPNVTELEKSGTVPKSRMEYLKRLDVFLRNQSEDCLYLNIYVPSSSRDEREPLPVLIYVHGESYSWGSGNPYDGSILASYGNVIVVTLNYRLGVFGFLTTDDGHARGNYGLMDQVAAIRFVEENIEQFGGDPGNITLLGHGTGAACVNLLMISPVAAANQRKLFRRAVLLSGSALVPSALSHDPKKYTMELARAVNCPVDAGSLRLVSCLKDKSAEELRIVKLDVPQFLTGFGPSIDGVFIPNQPRIIMRNYASLYRKYGLMVGLTRNEAVNMLTRKDLLQGFDETRQNRLLRTFVRNLFSYHLAEVFMSVKFEYADWERSPRPPTSTRDSMLEILGDSMVVSPVVEAAELHAGAVSLETFMYLFQHSRREGEEDYPGFLDSVIGDELPYLFGAPLLRGGILTPWGSNYTAQDAYVSEVFINLLVNYVRMGDPKRLSKKQTITLSDAVRQSVTTSNWPKFDADRQKYLYISSRTRDVRDHYRAHKMAFWTELIPKLNSAGTSIVPPSRDHHFLPDFDKLDSYEGFIRAVEILTLPPPPLPPSTTPPPWRNKTRAKTTSQSTSQSTHGNEVVVTPVDPEPLGYTSTTHGALTITVAIGCTLLVINILVCAVVYYQRNKLRMKYLNNNRSLPDKRNGVTPVKTEDPDNVETLLPPSSSSNNYSSPPTPLPVMHYHPGIPQTGERTPARTFNTFSDQHFQMNQEHQMPPSIPVPTLIRAMPHLGVHSMGPDQSLQRKTNVELLRKAATMSAARNAQESTEQDETAV